MAGDRDRGEVVESVDGVPVDEVVALLSGAPETFVAGRNARVKELKAGGDKELAGLVAKLRRPSQLVWAVGDIARRDPDLATEAVEAARAAEEATTGAGDIRGALESLREVVGRAAASGAADGGVDRPAIALALREVLVDPDARRAWAGGWLLQMPGPRSVPEDELAPRRARREAERSSSAERTGSTSSTPDEPEDSEQPTDRRARSRFHDYPTDGPDGQRKLTVAQAAAALKAQRRERDAALKKARRKVADLERDRSRAEQDCERARSHVEAVEARLAALVEEAESARRELAETQSALTGAAAEVDGARAELAELEAP
jgi:hypothetical protein